MAEQSCRQPSLDELLADPITILMMQSDGVDPAELRRLLESARDARVARIAAAEMRPN
jgi:uncharacterized membrane protein